MLRTGGNPAIRQQGFRAAVAAIRRSTSVSYGHTSTQFQRALYTNV